MAILIVLRHNELINKIEQDFQLLTQLLSEVTTLYPHFYLVDYNPQRNEEHYYTQGQTDHSRKL